MSFCFIYGTTGDSVTARYSFTYRGDGCQWIFLRLRTGEYVITNKSSGHVLSIIGASTEHGAQMEQTAFINDDSQLWIIEEVSQ